MAKDLEAGLLQFNFESLTLEQSSHQCPQSAPALSCDGAPSRQQQMRYDETDAYMFALYLDPPRLRVVHARRAVLLRDQSRIEACVGPGHMSLWRPPSFSYHPMVHKDN
jgi:hypothetical protein